MKRSLWEVDPVHSKVGLERKLGRHFHATTIGQLRPRPAEKAADLRAHPSGKPAVAAEPRASAHAIEGIGARGNDDAFRNLEILEKRFEVVIIGNVREVAALEANARFQLKNLSLELAPRHRRVAIETALDVQLTDRFDRAWPDAVACPRARFPEIRPAHEPGLGIEVGVDEQVLDVETVKIRVVFAAAR